MHPVLPTWAIYYKLKDIYSDIVIPQRFLVIRNIFICSLSSFVEIGGWMHTWMFSTIECKILYVLLKKYQNAPTYYSIIYYRLKITIFV